MAEELVDVVFLDIDGVLLPFGGGARDDDRPPFRFTQGCLFPDCTMDALTALEILADTSARR